MSTKNIVIFYTKAGGGHESAAKALKSEIELQDTKCTVVLIDPLENKNNISKKFERNYVLLTDKYTAIWALMSVLWRVKLFNEISCRFLIKHSKKQIQDVLTNYKPYITISTYFAFEHIVNEFNTVSNVSSRNMTVVSEIFKIPKIWFHYAGNFILFSDMAQKLALKYSKNSKLKQFGYLMNKQFNSVVKPEKQNPTSRLKILIVGGGSSMPRGEELIKKLILAGLPIDITCVCGRNIELQHTLEKLSTGFSNISVLGFVSNIKELMSESDFIISKAGPAIVLESISQQKPLFLYHYIWEHERGNVDFVLENGFGIYEPNFEKLIQQISEIVDDRNKLQPFYEKLSQSNTKSDIENTVKFILNGQF
jgi:UDP-N-acetylglucosamine:LPS N-acetylglucosamine transferase